MSPPVGSFHPRTLEEHIQFKTNGRRHKQPVDLQKCQLREMLQYSCELEGPRDSKKSRVVCEPVLRLFRSCANGLTVEVTSFDGIYDGHNESEAKES